MKYFFLVLSLFFTLHLCANEEEDRNIVVISYLQRFPAEGKLQWTARFEGEQREQRVTFDYSKTRFHNRTIRLVLLEPAQN